MKILHLSAEPIWDFEEKKGMPSIYLGLKGFADAGHSVLFCMPGRRDRTYDYDGIQIHEFTLKFPIISSRHLWMHRLSLKLFWFHFLLLGSIKTLKIAKAFRPDVVYGHQMYAAPVAWLVGKVLKIPNITRMYGTFLHPYLHSFLGRLRKFEAVVAIKTPCRYLILTNDGTRGDECARYLRIPESRIKFWRNGVDKDIFIPHFNQSAFKDSLNIPRDHKLIVAVSRLVGWKRVDRLISAMPKVLEKHPQTTAVIVGDGEDRAMLEDLARRLGIHERLRFVGLVLHEDVPQFYNAADLFVSLYDISNVGNPLLEALCCGKCIVTLDTGATAKIIENGVNGVLLKVQELEGLPAVLLGLLQDEGRRKRLEKGARDYALKNLQTWRERTAMEVKLIEDLVSAP